MLREARVAAGDAVFRETCRDVLRTDTIKITRDADRVGADWLDEIVTNVCASADKQNGDHVKGTNGHRKSLGGRLRGKRA